MRPFAIKTRLFPTRVFFATSTVALPSAFKLPRALPEVLVQPRGTRDSTTKMAPDPTNDSSPIEKTGADADRVEQAADTPAQQDPGKDYGLQAPEAIRHLTAEQRRDLELRVRRKIDWRLLPMIVLMYIMNYLDR